MNKVSALWKPAWYELDQPLTVGETSSFSFTISSSLMRFATGLDTEVASEVRAKILSIKNAQLGPILRIDTRGLIYSFFSVDGTLYLIEAEETPGRIENSNVPELYLKDTEFLVEIELI